MANGDGLLLSEPEEPRICEEGGKGLWFPLMDMEQSWPTELRCWIYGVALVYCFLGVSIIADAFLAAVEMITSRKRRVLNPATGRYMTILLWNDTVANLTLLALGSSAPEILLSVVDILRKKCFSGQLGPATIVGSAAFNLLVIIAVCIVAIPSSEVRVIKETPVFFITSFFSVVAYIWLLVIVKINSPEIVDIWEAVVTLAMFPILVMISYFADRGFCSREADRPLIAIPIAAVDDTWERRDSATTAETTSTGQAWSKTLDPSLRISESATDAGGTHSTHSPPAHPEAPDLSRLSINSIPKRGWNSEMAARVSAMRGCASHDDARGSRATTTGVQTKLETNMAKALSVDAGRRVSSSSEKHNRTRKASVMSGRSILSGKSQLSARSMRSMRSMQSAATHYSSHYSEVTQAYCMYPADPSRSALHPKRWIASHRAGHLTGSKRHMPHFEHNGQHDHPTLGPDGRLSVSVSARASMMSARASCSQSRRESMASVRHSFRHSARLSNRHSAMMRHSVQSGAPPVVQSKSHPPLTFRSHYSDVPDGLAKNRLSKELQPLASGCSLVREEESQQLHPHYRPGTSAVARSSAGVEHAADMHSVLPPASSSSHTAPPPSSMHADVGHHNGNNASSCTAEEPQNHHNCHNHNHQHAADAPQEALPAGDNGEFIVDMDDNPVICGQGVLTFCSDTLDVHAGADEREVIIPVLRRNGSNGTVCCRYRTECLNALPGYDYREVAGELEFPPGVTRGEIRLSVLPKRLWERNDRFQLILEDAEGGVVFNPNDDGGWDRCVLTITIINSNNQSQHTGLRAALSRLGERMVDPDSMRLGMDMWKEQVKEAIFCNGSYEEQATASAADWMLHIMVFPWKILYALFVPPPVYLGGWICFALALGHIALLTAAVCDLAELFGCVAGVDDSVTAITFVALGTSLPDLFASRSAAVADEYADASIVNVTGSNCVNVFLGIGMPWTLAAIYWRVKGATDKWKSRYPDMIWLHPRGAFVIKNDGLAFNVIVFGITAVICLCLIRMRRLAFGGELGGPFGAKVFSATLLVVLWALYLFLSIWRSKRKDASSSEIIGMVLLSVAVIVCLAIVFGVLLVLVPQNSSWLRGFGYRGGVDGVVVQTPEPGVPCGASVAVAAGPASSPMVLAAPPTPNGVPPVLNGAPLSVPPRGPPLDDEDLWGLEDGISGPPDAARLLKALHGCKVHQAWLQQEAARTLDAITAIEQVIRGDPGRGVISAEHQYSSSPMTGTAGEDEVMAQKNPSNSRSGATDGRSPSPHTLSVQRASDRRTHPVCWESHVSKDNFENAEVALENCDDQVATIGQCCDVLPDEKMSRHSKDPQFGGSQTPRGVSTQSSMDRTSTTRSSRYSAQQSGVSHDLIGMVQQDSHSTVPGSLPNPMTLQAVGRPLAPVCQSYSSGHQADSPQPIPIGSPEHAMRPPGAGKHGWCSDNM